MKPSDTQNVKGAVIKLKRNDNFLICALPKPGEGSVIEEYMRPKLSELISKSKFLRCIHFWRTIISKDMSNSLMQNRSIVKIILNWCNGLSLNFDEVAEQRMYLLKCLERKESLKTLMIINDTVEDEVADFIVSSLRMRQTLVELSCLVLKTSKQFSVPSYRFTRLRELKVQCLMSESKGAIFLRGICFCKCLKQLEIENFSPSMLLIAFPKWNGELQELFPLTERLYLDYPSTALLDRRLLGNVASQLHVGTDTLPLSTYAGVFSKIVRNDNSVRFGLKTFKKRKIKSKIKSQAMLTGRVHLNKHVIWNVGLRSISIQL